MKHYGMLWERFRALQNVMEALYIVTECYRALWDITAEALQDVAERYRTLQSIA